MNSRVQHWFARSGKDRTRSVIGASMEPFICDASFAIVLVVGFAVTFDTWVDTMIG
jgi:hypothetical protein